MPRSKSRTTPPGVERVRLRTGNLAKAANPMRSLAPVPGDGEGDGAELVGGREDERERSRNGGPDDQLGRDPLDLGELLPRPRDPIPPTARSAGDGRRASALPEVLPDPDPGEQRSRYDAERRLVLFNDHRRHLPRRR